MQNQSALPNFNAFADTHSPEALTSGVSWGAVFAGATAAAALSLILVILGFGLGLSAVSPWSYSAATIGTSTILWLAFTQIAAAGIGGFLAGSLRVKWGNLHIDEVHFRDTAHGLLAWAVASLVTAVLLGGVAKGILGGVVDVGAGAAGAVAPTAAAYAGSGMARNAHDSADSSMSYFTDMLLRSDQNTTDSNSDSARSEVNKIFVTDISSDKLSPEDRTYLAQIVAKRTGMSQADAVSRVDSIYARLIQTLADAKETAKEAADRARTAAAHSALWMFVALLSGAFVASLSATFGGRKRDRAQVHPRALF
jgi:hypothetical protein